MESVQAESAVAEGFGQIGVVYAAVCEGADIEEVAKDLRNHAPTILLVSCFNDEMATQMGEALGRPAVTRGGGGKAQGKGRPSPSEYQVKFHVEQRRTLIVAGRDSIVRDVVCKLDAAQQILVAECCFSVSFHQMMSMNVAVMNMQALEYPLDGLAAILTRHTVRVLAGEWLDRHVETLRVLRRSMAVRAIALEVFVDPADTSRRLGSPAMVMAGPVNRCEMLEVDQSYTWRKRSSREQDLQVLTRPSQFTELCTELTGPTQAEVGPSSTADEGRGWPIIDCVRQKAVNTLAPRVIKFSVFMGSKNSRRTPQAQEAREGARARRAYWGNYYWAQGGRSRGGGDPIWPR